MQRSIGTTPSELLFGVSQRGTVVDFLRERLEENDLNNNERNLADIRDKAAENISKSQNYNKLLKDKHRTQRKYMEGDYVMVKNYISNPGACKKIAPKFKGPYRVCKILPNDRYILRDVEGFQLSQIPYEGIWEVANMKPWLNHSLPNESVIGTITCQDGRTVAAL